MCQRIIVRQQNYMPFSRIWGIFMKVRRLDFPFDKILNTRVNFSCCLSCLSDHRWPNHCEHVQPAGYENSLVGHLTELQSVSPQQPIQPCCYSPDSLPVHMDPPLSVPSVVRSCVLKYLISQNDINSSIFYPKMSDTLCFC